MKIAYFDCIAGVSGDMILGALVDAGLEFGLLAERLKALNLDEFSLEKRKVVKKGFTATKIDVLVHDHTHERHLSEIQQIIDKSSLPGKIKEKSVEIFKRLCEVEAGIHNSTYDKVHLHELGGTDTIVDVAGALIGLDELGIDEVYCSPLPVSRGFVSGAHGQIPLPAPAAIALLKDVPVYGVETESELVTPTGAVLMKNIVKKFGPLPKMTLKEIGYGAGSKDFEIPNLLRVFIGEKEQDDSMITEYLTLMETNIDDQNPEFYDHIMVKLFENGALDVFLTNIQMKKNRPGTKLGVLCADELTGKLEQIIFRETSTLGIRYQKVMRRSLPRELKEVLTSYGTISVKIARIGDDEFKVIPEYDDCRRIASEKNIPLRSIYSAVEKAAVDSLNFNI